MAGLHTTTLVPPVRPGATGIIPQTPQALSFCSIRSNMGRWVDHVEKTIRSESRKWRRRASPKLARYVQLNGT